MAVSSSSPGSGAPRGSGSPRVLVVDDSVDAAETLAMLLERKGCSITTALDGASAIEAFARVDPELVLLDLGLPDIDGYTVARTMSDKNPHALLIALTGFGDAQTRQAVQQSCFHRHLVKPIDVRTLDELLALVNTTTR